MRTAVLLLTYYGCVLYGFFNPAFGILFFIHITIFRPDALVWGNLAFGRLHLFASIAALVGYLIHRASLRPTIDDTYQKGNIRVMALFVAWLVFVSLLAEYSVERSLEKAIEIAKIVVICFLFSRVISDRKWIEVYVWVASVSFGLLSFWGALQGMLGNPRLETLWPGGSNYIAAQLALIAPLALAKALDPGLRLKWKLMFAGCIASIVLCCIYTESRGAFVGMAIGLVALISQTRQRLKIFAAMLLVVIALVPWIPDRYHERITSIGVQKEQRDTSAQSRFVLWEIAFRIWQDYPIAGVGLENFSPAKETYAGQVADIVESEEMYALLFNRQRYPHGMYQGMLAEVGVIGVALYLWVLARSILCPWPRAFAGSERESGLYLQAKGAQAGLIGFAAAAVFGDFQYIEMPYLQMVFIGATRGYADAMSRAACATERQEVGVVRHDPIRVSTAGASSR